jgi:hypothetical protein
MGWVFSKYKGEEREFVGKPQETDHLKDPM